MTDRRIHPDHLLITGAGLGVVASFLTWYHHAGATADLSVNGLRAGAFGALFFLVCAAAVLAVLVRQGTIRSAQRLRTVARERTTAVRLAAAAATALLLQLALGGAGTHRPSLGVVVAFLSVVLLAGASLIERPQRGGLDGAMV